MAEENCGEQELDNVPENSNPFEDIPNTETNSTVADDKKWPGWPGENVYRMLVPIQRVGVIIGRKGEFIKKIYEETKARIKIIDGPPGTTERTVMISAKEEPDLAIPPALDGLLKIHKRVIDAESDLSNVTLGGSVCTRLLVAATQAGSLIGKQGATIKSIQDDSNCSIRVLGAVNLPVLALPDDSLVEIQGEPAGTHKAVELIALHLRKFLVDRSIVGVFEMQGHQNVSLSRTWGSPPPSFPMNSGGHGYGSSLPFSVPHSHPYDNHYPSVDMPSLEKQPHYVPPAFGRDVSKGANKTSIQLQQAVIAKVTQNIQIPLSYADAVIGVNGGNISYIRRASGATIAIQETKSVPGEMTVEINGSASQVQAAQQLIQNSVAEAVSNAGYNPYTPQGPPPSNLTSGLAGHAGDFSYMYGSSYGY